MSGNEAEDLPGKNRSTHAQNENGAEFSLGKNGESSAGSGMDIPAGGSCIELRHVSAGYRTDDTKNILHDVSFSVPKGRNVCILGKNGCGKTTLLRVMIGLLPSAGEVLIDGMPLRKMKRKEIAKHLALMSQFSDIYFSYSVWETVLLGRYLYSSSLLGNPSKEDAEAAEECLRATNLLELKDRQITELSGGQLQRVFLARTFAQGAPVILLDEPTNHLDLKNQKELVKNLREWSAGGSRTVIGVFHDIALALEMADYLIMMKDGRIAAEGRAEDVLSGEMLQEIYGFDVSAYMKERMERWKNL